MAQDWVEELLDPGSFAVTAAGGRAGHGLVDGRPVCVYDGLGPPAVAALDLALKVGCPVVGVGRGGGTGGAAGARRGCCRAACSRPGSCPRWRWSWGPAREEAALVPALADVVVMVEGEGRLQLGDAAAIETVTGELVDAEELAGTRAHTVRTGTAQFRAADLAEAVDLTRAAARSTCPATTWRSRRRWRWPATRPVVTSRDLELDGLLPATAELPFDVAPAGRAGGRRRGAAGGAGAVRRQPAVRVRAGGRASGRGGGQPAAGAGRGAGRAPRPRRRPGSSAPATPSTCRCSTFVDGPGFAARRRAGAPGPGPAGGQAGLRLRRGNGAQGHGGGPPGGRPGGRRARWAVAPGRPGAGLAGRCGGRAGPADEAAAGGWLHDVVRPAQTRPRVSAALRLLRGKREAAARKAPREHPAVTAPLFHVKRGDPTPEELAALTAVLAIKAGAAAAARSRPATPAHRPGAPRPPPTGDRCLLPGLAPGIGGCGQPRAPVPRVGYPAGPGPIRWRVGFPRARERRGGAWGRRCVRC